MKVYEIPEGIKDPVPGQSLHGVPCDPIQVQLF